MRLTLLKLVIALGVTQIIGFGSLYYAFALIVPTASVEFGVKPSLLFGVFSLGFLLAGFAAPRIGRAMDEVGAPRIMAGGSLVASALLLAISFAPGFPAFVALILLLELVALTVLYDAAFATLARLSGPHARRNITRLTLIAGFASTLFWPLTGWLVQEIGWRGTYAVFAGMHLFIAFPLHLWIARGQADPTTASVTAPASAPAFAPLRPQAARKAFAVVAVSFALSGLVISAMSVHMVGTLEAAGLGASATLIAMLMGPAQVLSRVIEAAAAALPPL
ncbi:MAG: MFS transporter [Phyllobacteriaceae bacterium]|nr:MFS transporter [Phyllobacteriaceae bacterium]